METISLSNKGNVVNSLQIAIMGNVPAGNFSINDNKGGKQPFLLKNITEENITIDIIPAGQSNAINTILYPGWNVELVNQVNGVTANTLQYGY